MEAINEFFKAYAKHAVVGAPADIAAYYDTSFIMAGPHASEAVSNDLVFLKWLGAVFSYNKKHGLQSMEVKQLDASSFGESFYNVKVTWSAVFPERSTGTTTFDIRYILRKAETGLKIICYISEEDQARAMDEAGVITDAGITTT
ncbi:MAG: hypothetical protein EOO01_29000 [Chitinophagaceae bacterium]|nr:MAG: hypothetical protein EOO01_29000 [Chitinophagaceae bacterium]